MTLEVAIQESKLFIQLNTMINANENEQATLAKNPVCHQYSKHVDKVQLYKDRFKNGTIKLDYISSNENVADFFTKHIGREKLNEFFTALNGVLY